MSRAEVSQTQVQMDVSLLKDINSTIAKAQTFSELLAAVEQGFTTIRRCIGNRMSISQDCMHAVLNTINTAIGAYCDLNEEKPGEATQEKHNILSKCMKELLGLFLRHMESREPSLKNCMIAEFTHSILQIMKPASSFPAEIYFSFLSHAPVLPFNMRDSYTAFMGRISTSGMSLQSQDQEIREWSNRNEGRLGCDYLRWYFYLLNLACKSIASGNTSEANTQSLNALLEKVITEIATWNNFSHIFIGYTIALEELTKLSGQYDFFAQACAAAIEKQPGQTGIFHSHAVVLELRLLLSLRISIEEIYEHFLDHPHRRILNRSSGDAVEALFEYESKTMLKELDPYSLDHASTNVDDYVYDMKNFHQNKNLFFQISLDNAIKNAARVYFEKLRTDVLEAIDRLTTFVQPDDKAALKNLALHLSNSEASNSRGKIISHIANIMMDYPLSDNVCRVMSALCDAVSTHMPKRDSNNLLNFYTTIDQEVMASTAAHSVMPAAANLAGLFPPRHPPVQIAAAEETPAAPASFWRSFWGNCCC